MGGTAGWVPERGWEGLKGGYPSGAGGSRGECRCGRASRVITHVRMTEITHQVSASGFLLEEIKSCNVGHRFVHMNELDA